MKRSSLTYFVDAVAFQTTKHTLTGAGIKARIDNFQPHFGLFKEGRRDVLDTAIADSDTLVLGWIPPQFYTAPPATFGAGV